MARHLEPAERRVHHSLLSQSPWSPWHFDPADRKCTWALGTRLYRLQKWAAIALARYLAPARGILSEVKPEVSIRGAGQKGRSSGGENVV